MPTADNKVDGESFRLSIVIPIYNEQDNLPELCRRLASSLDGYDFETIFVNDASRDGSAEIIRELNSRDRRFRMVTLARNFGHQTAITTGLMYATGDAVAIMDGDLQDPPEVLPRFVEKLREGYDVVYAVRTKRKEGPLKRACYAVFYRILRRLANVDIPLDSGDFCVMSRRVVRQLREMPERTRFLRGLRAWLGYRQIGVEYERDARFAGQTKYTPQRLLKLAADGIFSFSHLPLRLASMLGVLIAGVGLIGAVAYVFMWFMDWHKPNTPHGFTTLAVAIFFFAGVQLLSIGILGEYIARIYEEVKGRPHFTVAETVGFDGADDTQSGPSVDDPTRPGEPRGIDGNA